MFLERVDLWVRDALHSGVGTFNDLLTKLPGVYPSVAFESARRIAACDTSLSRTLTSILQHTGNHKIHQNHLHQLDLPIPHPLDYDWRFSDQTVGQLLAACERMTKPGQTVVLLG